MTGKRSPSPARARIQLRWEDEGNEGASPGEREAVSEKAERPTRHLDDRVLAT